MSKQESKSTESLVFVVRTSAAPEVFVSLPLTLRTDDPLRAATWTDEALARKYAKAVMGQVVMRRLTNDTERTIAEAMRYRPNAEEPRARLTVVRTEAPAKAKRGKSKTPPQGTPVANPIPSTGPLSEPEEPITSTEPHGDAGVTREEPPKDTTTETHTAPSGQEEGAAREPAEDEPHGLPRSQVVELLKAAGLSLTVKSSEHWHGRDQKGPRLVLPMAQEVVRIFLYQIERPELLGYVPPEERKARKLGRVSVVADVTTMDEVKALIEAVRQAVAK